MLVKAISTQKTIIPDGYCNGSVDAFKQWQKAIHEEIEKTQIATTVVLLEAQKVLATRQYRTTRAEQKRRYKAPMPPEKGDRIVIAALFIAAFLIALIGTLIETP